jgi:hypothetical protein
MNSNSSDFWVFVTLKEFVANEGEGEVPLEGSIPNMKTVTEYYIILQKIYQEKAEADSLSVERRVRSILNIGRDPDSIPRENIKSFAKCQKINMPLLVFTFFFVLWIILQHHTIDILESLMRSWMRMFQD